MKAAPEYVRTPSSESGLIGLGVRYVSTLIEQPGADRAEDDAYHQPRTALRMRRTTAREAHHDKYGSQPGKDVFRSHTPLSLLPHPLALNAKTSSPLFDSTRCVVTTYWDNGS